MIRSTAAKASCRRRADDDALAGGEAVGLDDDRILARRDVLARRFGMVEDLELGRRHVGVAHQGLGEHLARFELGGVLRGAEDAQAGFLEVIDDAARQRFLGTDDGQADLFLLGETDELVEVVVVERDVDAVLGGAGVAGRAEDALDAPATGPASKPGRVHDRLCRERELSCADPCS